MDGAAGFYGGSLIFSFSGSLFRMCVITGFIALLASNFLIDNLTLWL